MEHKQILSKALTYLDSIGAKYCVEFGGATFGELKVAEPKKQYIRRRLKHIYHDALLAMQPGDSYEFVAQDNDELASLQGAISSQMIFLWGKGKGSTTIQRAGGKFVVVGFRHKEI